MKVFLILFLSTLISYSQTVEEIANKTIKELEALSACWKTMQDEASTKKALTKTKEQIKKLSELATQLKSLPVPTNEEREKMYKTRSKKIEAVSMEMAQSITMLNSRPELIVLFAEGMKPIQKDFKQSSAVFDTYFKPDQKQAPQMPK